ncbi:MAG TPA: glycosyltransferase family 2 protein [Leptolyngbyaceae cyanobacterium M33_DOE_097]|nr:glycosyltransferase family 2 protein [Leptolyngbyaceae cyanobacterium M33_DOE_097]
MSLSTPVGFLIFNRPDVTEKVFSAIAQVKPKQLFVIADGPRPDRPGEMEKCEQTRSIIQKVDWDCEVLTDFSEVNLGCGRREATGFDWVFSQVEEAIFLEDDTYPAPTFFSFCEAMLERYRNDTRIMHINGDNSANQGRTSDSYYFSKYIHSWGWASWRRAWQHYDYQMKTWLEFKQTDLLEQIFEDFYEQQYWVKIFDQMYEDPQVIDTWDYQWIYACWSQSGLAITPQENLISNLGFNREDAAHTKGDNPRSKLSLGVIEAIQHPPFVVRHREADRHSFDQIYGGKTLREQDKPLVKIRQRLSSFKHQFTLPV